VTSSIDKSSADQGSGETAASASVEAGPVDLKLLSWMFAFAAVVMLVDGVLLLVAANGRTWVTIAGILTFAALVLLAFGAMVVRK
jgi:cytochrome b subunit of formate dehydrogenase